MICRVTIGKWRFTFSIAPTTKVTGVNSNIISPVIARKAVIDTVAPNIKTIPQDDDHIIMWDFDDVPLLTVERTLRDIQAMYQLPLIRIFETKKPQKETMPNGTVEKQHHWKDGERQGNYIAWCFKRCSFIKALEIVVITKGVCWGFIKWSVYRKHFTSRVTPKHDRKIRLVAVLDSEVPEDVAVEELRSWVHYETLADNFPMKVHELEVGTVRT